MEMTRTTTAKEIVNEPKHTISSNFSFNKAIVFILGWKLGDGSFLRLDWTVPAATAAATVAAAVG